MSFHKGTAPGHVCRASSKEQLSQVALNELAQVLEGTQPSMSVVLWMENRFSPLLPSPDTGLTPMSWGKREQEAPRARGCH